MPLTWNDNMSTDNFNAGAMYTPTNAGNPATVLDNVMVGLSGGVSWADNRTPVVFPNLSGSCTYKWNLPFSESPGFSWVSLDFNSSLGFQMDAAIADTMYLSMYISTVQIFYLTKPTVPVPGGDYTITVTLDYTGYFRGEGSDGQFIDTTISRAHMRALAAINLYPNGSQ